VSSEDGGQRFGLVGVDGTNSRMRVGASQKLALDRPRDDQGARILGPAVTLSVPSPRATDVPTMEKLSMLQHPQFGVSALII
jgi:hypothetical protein